ncbi:type II secretion system minor pseudopilin GspI [Aestuariicella hydrocarbonica]|uniref:Type II secretion system protein I n=1 Tax=Pseudomaricurvus hydrocarbonicus TaxID=1470433 RepID=A0A9E5JNZ5_9GAMM|nr:type II secretion system minor pseudopilin GspI [Aestuariicella hydrocarbonica]
MDSSTNRGFTLLEVMIALIIFAICATTLIQQSGRSLRQASFLESRTLANWIAENELDQLRLEQQFPAVGKTSRLLVFGLRQWNVIRDISKTAHPDLRRVVIHVQRAKPDKTQSSQEMSEGYRLTSFLGRY